MGTFTIHNEPSDDTQIVDIDATKSLASFAEYRYDSTGLNPDGSLKYLKVINAVRAETIKTPAPTRYTWKYDISTAVVVYGGITFNNPADGCGGNTRIHSNCTGYSRQTDLNSYNASKKFSTVYAPIYSYRVSDYRQAVNPCVEGGNTTPASLGCTYPQGYKRIEILCHGSSSFSSTPAWVTGYYDSGHGAAVGAYLQVPHDTEQAVTYDELTDTYVGVIDQDYDWNYFDFIPFTLPSPKYNCTFNAYSRAGALLRTSTVANECADYRILGCSTDPVSSNLSFNLEPERIVVSFTGLAPDPSALNAYFSPLPQNLITALASNQKNKLQVWVVDGDSAVHKLSIESEGDCPVPQLSTGYERLCPPGTCEVHCNGDICCYDENGYAV